MPYKRRRRVPRCPLKNKCGTPSAGLLENMAGAGSMDRMLGSGNRQEGNESGMTWWLALAWGCGCDWVPAGRARACSIIAGSRLARGSRGRGGRALGGCGSALGGRGRAFGGREARRSARHEAREARRHHEGRRPWLRGVQQRQLPQLLRLLRQLLLPGGVPAGVGASQRAKQRAARLAARQRRLALHAHRQAGSGWTPGRSWRSSTLRRSLTLRLPGSQLWQADQPKGSSG